MKLKSTWMLWMWIFTVLCLLVTRTLTYLITSKLMLSWCINNSYKYKTKERWNRICLIKLILSLCKAHLSWLYCSSHDNWWQLIRFSQILSVSIWTDLCAQSVRALNFSILWQQFFFWFHHFSSQLQLINT